MEPIMKTTEKNERSRSTGNGYKNDNDKKRKLIDLPVSTTKTLGIMAVQENMSLKSYIERILIKTAEQARESEILLQLSDVAGGNCMLTDQAAEQIIRYLKELKKQKTKTEKTGRIGRKSVS